MWFHKHKWVEVCKEAMEYKEFSYLFQTDVPHQPIVIITFQCSDEGCRKFKQERIHGWEIINKYKNSATTVKETSQTKDTLEVRCDKCKDHIQVGVSIWGRTVIKCSCATTELTYNPNNSWKMIVKKL